MKEEGTPLEAAKEPRRAREKINPDETARQRFQRIGGKRTKTALAKIKLLANINNTRAYEYASADVDKIENALRGRVDMVIAEMRAGLEKGPASAASEDFSL